MKFPVGHYKTVLGLPAIVAQLKSRLVDDKPMWLLRGSVKLGGVYYMHVWTVDGRSGTNDPNFDLTRTK